MTHTVPPPRNNGEFLTKNIWPWLEHYFHVLFHSRAAFPAYKPGHSGIFPIADACSIALAADWGTGTIPAYKVVSEIMKTEPDVTIHLGDVYYSGTPQEYNDWFLGREDWPHGAVSTWALNANHEMYSGGHGYFETALPKLEQETSYFCLENDHWRILGLDSGYYSGVFPLLEKLWRGKIRLHDVILEWLKTTVFADAHDTRPVILLTHHQPFSAFDPGYPTLLKNVQPYLDRTVLWFWGHEHRFAGYGPVAYAGGRIVRGRCIGHGGMPIEQTAKPKDVRTPNLVFYDDRVDAGMTQLAGVPVGYCGFASLALDGPVLTVRYIDQEGVLLFTEKWDCSSGKAVGSIAPGDGQLNVVHPAGLDALVAAQPAPVTV